MRSVWNPVPLQELRERVRSASAASRNLDAEVYNCLFNESGNIAFQIQDWSSPLGSRLDRDHDGWLIGKDSADENGGGLPHYTDSVDTALELVEQILPGWLLMGLSASRPETAESQASGSALAELANDRFEVQGRGASRALAILDALLSGLIAEREQGG